MVERTQSEKEEKSHSDKLNFRKAQHILPYNVTKILDLNDLNVLKSKSYI